MNIRPVKNEDDHKSALSRIEQLWDSEKVADIDELEVLSVLVEQYEKEHFSIEEPDPIEAIKFRQEQLGANNEELGKVLGQRSRVSEIMKYQRPLSISMIRNLHEKWNLPADLLIKKYDTKRTTQ